MKRITALILVAALLLAAFCGCGKKETAEYEYTGIVSAMDNEIDMLLSEAEIDHVDTIANVDYHVGTLRGDHVIIAKAGIGKVRASSGMTAMLDRYPISRVIFTGIAGGVDDETDALDEVIATRLVEHDFGTITDDGFRWSPGDLGIDSNEGGYYYCDPDLVELAYEAAVEVVGKEHVFKGTIATGDQFIASKEYVARLKQEYDAYACEMEGASVAVVCIRYGKPFVVIRSMSDKADGEAHESYANLGDLAADNSSRIVLRMLDSLD